MSRTFALLISSLMISSRLWADYDPLLTADVKTEQVDFGVKDMKRSREIPIRVYLPADKKAAPVVLFSHGLGGNREGSAFLGKHWASRGYVAVFLQHPGSDDSVWKDLPIAQRMAALKKAAGLKEFLLRVQDVPAVLDQLEVWNKDAAHALAGRFDLNHVGTSGHSFGAVTTQAVSGHVPGERPPANILKLAQLAMDEDRRALEMEDHIFRPTLLDATSRLNANDAVWEFFQAHPKPNP